MQEQTDEFDKADWDLPEAPSTFHRCGRTFAYAFWLPYKALKLWSDVRSFERYPLAADIECFSEQVNFLLVEVKPIIDSIKAYRATPFYRPCDKHDASLKYNLRQAWAKRPKKRRVDTPKGKTNDPSETLE